MSAASEAIVALSYAGVGAAVGSIGVAAINSRAGRGEARAHAADLIAEAAGDLVDRQAAAINRLELRLDRMAQALVMLTSVDDELLDRVSMPTGDRAKLQKAVREAKLAI